MTIANACLELIATNGPMTAEQLGEACRAAGLTQAACPAASVASSLGWNTDGRAVKIDDRFHRVVDLMDGRWLTVRLGDSRGVDHAPELGSGDWFAEGRRLPDDATRDLCVWRGFGRRQGLSLAGGGALRSEWMRWRAPDGWEPPGLLVGFRLMDGVLVASEVVLDDATESRGQELLRRLTPPGRGRGFDDYDGDTRLAKALLAAVHEDADLLREPVPPLSSLWPPTRHGSAFEPAYAQPSSWGRRSLAVTVTDSTARRLDELAVRDGMAVERWVEQHLESLVHEGDDSRDTAEVVPLESWR